jgi:hypothetical protein
LCSARRKKRKRNNNNNAVINNNYGRLQDLILLSKFQYPYERISPKFIENSGMRPQKGLPLLI